MHLIQAAGSKSHTEVMCMTAQASDVGIPYAALFKASWRWSWTNCSGWPCLGRRLVQMASRGPFPLQQFHDSVFLRINVSCYLLFKFIFYPMIKKNVVSLVHEDCYSVYSFQNVSLLSSQFEVKSLESLENSPWRIYPCLFKIRNFNMKACIVRSH